MNQGKERYFEAILAITMTLIVMFFIFGCGTTPVDTTSNPSPTINKPTPTKPKPKPSSTPSKTIIVDARPSLAWDGKHSEAGLWTEYVLQALEKSKLPDASPKDFADWCPAFPKLTKTKKSEVFAALISKMAQYESGYKNSHTYKEDFKDAKGNYVISRGLLQISQESANGYSCGITDAQMLHQARVNLSCGVKIIDRWVGRDGVFAGYSEGKWLGVGRYWSVMRSRSKSYEKIRAYLRNYETCVVKK